MTIGTVGKMSHWWQSAFAVFLILELRISSGKGNFITTGHKASQVGTILEKKYKLKRYRYSITKDKYLKAIVLSPEKQTKRYNYFITKRC